MQQYTQVETQKATEGWEYIKGRLKSEIAKCTYCTASVEPVSKVTACGACFILNVTAPVQDLAYADQLVGCVTRHCK